MALYALRRSAARRMSEWAADLDGQTVELVAVNRDAGSVVLFDAVSAQGRPCLVAADYRAAEALAARLAEDDGPVFAVVEPWQMLG